jgi:hypothetical protein
VGNHGYEADYAQVWVDGGGNPFDGSKRYEFPLETLPPVDAFWSITMHDLPNFYLVADRSTAYERPDHGHQCVCPLLPGRRPPAPLIETRGGELPVRWLVAEWPQGEPEPVKYWLASLPAEVPLQRLVGLAKLRWRVEHDYRELKDALGLDHFEGRSFRGWHHHVTLVSVAHAFVTLQRLDPKRLRRPDHLCGIA